MNRTNLMMLTCLIIGSVIGVGVSSINYHRSAAKAVQQSTESHTLINTDVGYFLLMPDKGGVNKMYGCDRVVNGPNEHK